MVNATTKLAITDTPEDDFPAPAVYRFDRRRCDRHDLGGCVTAVRRDHDMRIHRRPVCSLRLRNLSDGGIGAISDIPLSPDERISVYFQPHGADQGFELVGHVVRCQPLRAGQTDKDLPVTGYEIGLRFDPATAA
ncbi:PilZ domain-containing protein [Planctomycetales bacterium ZRK34]|nr:PilZ domain-containing protein [Planctomycetales bacterium ZRK34]